MEVIVLHDQKDISLDKGDFLRFALSEQPLAGLLLNALKDSRYPAEHTKYTIAVPEKWSIASKDNPGVTSYNFQKGLCPKDAIADSDEKWLVISNGRFATKANYGWIRDTLDSLPSDVVNVTLDPKLSGYHEKVRLTPDSNMVGLRRFYSDSVELCDTPEDWPHHVFIKFSVLAKLLVDEHLPLDFDEFNSRCQAASIRTDNLNVAGSVLDLETEAGMVAFISERIESEQSNVGRIISDDSVRFIGKILAGNNVTVGKNAVIAGPAVIGDNVTIEDDAVVKASVIGPNVTVHSREIIQDSVITSKIQRVRQHGNKTAVRDLRAHWANGSFSRDYFRTWPKWSYPRYFKRFFDIVASLMVLGLFVPLFPIIVLAIKLSSPGPVFYKARRQGLGGKPFDCLKFRSMMETAEDIQEKLRFINQVDGPQFKMENDPRVNAVGRFLRETNIDEIPQFINVLMGQMSIMGPRPSPEHENTSCPYWRYARLSVRPGITGLWQMCRTREEGRDFQEWVHYDVEYVRRLSFKLDVWIFWKTAWQLINNFIDQF